MIQFENIHQLWLKKITFEKICKIFNIFLLRNILFQLVLNLLPLLKIQSNITQNYSSKLLVQQHVDYSLFLEISFLQALNNKNGDFPIIYSYKKETMISTLIEIKMTKQMGKGVFAAENIPAGTTLIQVHKSNFITYSLMAENPFLESIMNRTNHKKVEFCYFIAYCELQEQDTPTTQMIKSYVQNLPRSFNNLICWSDQQLNLLDNKQLVKKIKSKKVQYRQSFNKLVKFLKEKTRENIPRQDIEEISSKKKFNKRGTRSANIPIKHFDTTISEKQMNIIERIRFEDVLRYMAVVESRNAYYMDINDATSKVGALVPQLQMFNHSQFSKCDVFLYDNYYSVITQAQIEKGEQIFLDYGPNTTETYLQFYGMIPLQVAKFIDKENVSEPVGWDIKDEAVSKKQQSEVSQHTMRRNLVRLYNSLQNKVEHESDQSSNRPALLVKNL